MCDLKFSKIRECLTHVLKPKGHKDFSVEIEGQTANGDGYIGEVIFVKVTDSESKQSLHLAIKSSMDIDPNKKEKSGLNNLYSKEIYIYENVKSTYENLLKEYGIQNCLNFMPYCYGSNGSEFLVLENLKSQKFELWNKANPMSDDHIRLVLQSYGKWHALSVALKSQKPKVYKALTKNNINALSVFSKRNSLYTTVFKEFQNALKGINFEDSKILKLLQFSEDDCKNVFIDKFSEDPEYSVILHGDCWNNNFLFKTPDKNNPLQVRILDWQCSGIESPIFDLSYFIYACADTEKNIDVKELLDIYYKSFSELLHKFGCQAKEKLPFEKLTEHWKRFSHFGVFLSIIVLRLCTMKEETPKPNIKETVDNGLALMEAFTFKPTTDKDFLKRCKNNFLHYCKNCGQ